MQRKVGGVVGVSLPNDYPRALPFPAGSKDGGFPVCQGISIMEKVFGPS